MGSGGSRSGGTGGGGGGFGIKHEGGSSGTHIFKTEGAVYISSDEDETEGRKKNIDDLQRVVDLTIEDDQQDGDVFAPVRLKREPHKDRTVAFIAGPRPNATQSTSKDSTSTQATSEKRKGKQRANDVVITQVRAKRPTAYSSSDEETDDKPIKTEAPEEEISGRPVTPPTAPMTATNLPTSPPPSPESRREAKEMIKTSDDNPDDEEADEDEYPLPEMPKFQTQAEADEWRRHHDDLDIIRKELGRQALTSLAEDSSDPRAVAAYQRAKKAEEIRSEHVYLFQFPPALPDLVPVRVKPDPDAAEVHDDAMQVDPPSQPADIKKEAGSEVVKPVKPSAPSGSVGKLRIHKSGKAILDWGGTSLVLSAGTDPSFLQNILIATVPEKKPGEEVPVEEQEPAIGMSMGQVRGKFVVTPNWDEILR
jgi:DNA-directed RNA polymerase III subunit RPC4